MIKTRIELGDYTIIVGGRPKRHRGAYPRGTRCWTVIGHHEHRGRRPTVAQGVLNRMRSWFLVINQNEGLPDQVIAKLDELIGLEPA